METLSAIEHVRTHPERFLRQVPPSPIELAQLLAGDTLILGGSKVIILRQDEWYGVGSDVVWLPTETEDVASYFEEIKPFPQAGVNSVHSEVLLGAFASGIAVWIGDKNILARGPDIREIDDGSNPFPEWVRQGVMFKLSDDGRELDVG